MKGGGRRKIYIYIPRTTDKNCPAHARKETFLLYVHSSPQRDFVPPSPRLRASKQKARIIFPFRPLPLFSCPPSGEATPTLLPFLFSYGGREEVRGLNCPPSLPPPFLCRIGVFKGRIRKARRAEGGLRGRREMSDLSSLIYTPSFLPPPFPRLLCKPVCSDHCGKTAPERKEGL